MSAPTGTKAADRTPPNAAQFSADTAVKSAPERREKAWATARQIAQMLHEEYGATRVRVFGSLVHGGWFGPKSDIDLAVWGIPAHRFYCAVAAATGYSHEFEIDLLDPHDCRPVLRQVIEDEGFDL